MALNVSFMMLQTSLVNVRDQVTTLIMDCNSRATAAGSQQIQDVCNMIPPPSTFNTSADADLNNVSAFHIIIRL